MNRLAIALLLLIFGGACEHTGTSTSEISAEALLSRPAEEVLILDVRTADEYAGGHVPGAINISHEQLADRVAELGEYQETEVVVYCHSGKRAGIAKNVLDGSGFSRVSHLSGDMSGWREAGHPIAKPDLAARAQLAKTAAQVFGTLPEAALNPNNSLSDAKIELGRMLYYEPRLSKNHDVSCNSCHGLDNYGQDNQPNSPGHRGQRGGRSSPSVYNAALHLAQFWDGREPDVEAQAKGPVLNPIEMAMPSADAVVALLSSIPGYVGAFAAAFPEDPTPVNYDNLGLAIGAFERRLITPSRFDDFVAGDLTALRESETEGLETFIQVGCVTCHLGPAVGGSLYRKLGLVQAYPSEDVGRLAVTGNEGDRGVFKVPSLRNIAKTGPYLHDGSVATLAEMIRIMARHQLGSILSPAQVRSIGSFLASLTGRVDFAYIAEPVLPEGGPNTPAPDPS